MPPPRRTAARPAWTAFADDIAQTLIILYGTRDNVAANRDAAAACQRAIRIAWNNVDLPMKADTEATDADLKNNHLILVGRPSTNTVSRRFVAAIRAFGPASFTVRADTYANTNSAVLAAGVNPLNRRFSINLIAGNSGVATLAHAGDLAGRGRGPEVRVCDALGRSISMVVPAPELVKSFAPGDDASRSARQIASTQRSRRRCELQRINPQRRGRILRHRSARHDLAELCPQFVRERAFLAGADAGLVDLVDRDHLRGRARQEHFLARTSPIFIDFSEQGIF